MPSLEMGGEEEQGKRPGTALRWVGPWRVPINEIEKAELANTAWRDYWNLSFAPSIFTMESAAYLALAAVFAATEVDAAYSTYCNDGYGEQKCVQVMANSPR